MNHREPTSVPKGAGRTFHGLALLLLPLLATNRAWARPNLPATVSMTPPGGYLIAVGAPSLRFQAAIPPPDLVTRPAASAPPKPAADNSPDHPDVLVYSSPPVAASTEALHPRSDKRAPQADTDSEEDSPVMPQTPPPILRDDLQRHARPEDILPYFQIPGGQSGNVDVIVPVPRSAATPAPLPTSSATYTQSPR